VQFGIGGSASSIMWNRLLVEKKWALIAAKLPAAKTRRV
jgi:hypothetical protein